MANILEKIVNTRLIWFLEKAQILSDQQSGFRNHRSTIDRLTIIKSEVNDALNSNQYLGLISIDIAKPKRSSMETQSVTNTLKNTDRRQHV